ncbi:hypothetical protein BLA29_000101 [Euroglyphus maynei]|uniref:Uncharacterized protein n=1 Tax=Euroglyphus maynei TaxID=6958 RepID=A0A1Y3B7P4_EURMA|nr:hypothetical protein BLA29_000101 [Euroglyphus maynei]
MNCSTVLPCDWRQEEFNPLSLRVAFTLWWQSARKTSSRLFNWNRWMSCCGLPSSNSVPCRMNATVDAYWASSM